MEKGGGSQSEHGRTLKVREPYKVFSLLHAMFGVLALEYCTN